MLIGTFGEPDPDPIDCSTSVTLFENVDAPSTLKEVMEETNDISFNSLVGSNPDSDSALPSAKLPHTTSCRTLQRLLLPETCDKS